MMKFKWKDMMLLKIQKIYKTKTETKLILIKFRLINYKTNLIKFNNKMMKQKKIKTNYFQNK